MEKRKIFIATHSNLSEGFKNAAKLIVGDMSDTITTFSLYEGGSADYFREEIALYIEKHPNREIVVLTDLYGASLFNAMALLSNKENVFVFTGINLSLVLDILLDKTELDKTIIEHKLDEVRKGMLWLEKLEEGIEEEF